MKACKGCEHYSAEGYSGECEHPKNITESAVTGDKGHIYPPSVMRVGADENAFMRFFMSHFMRIGCGPNAKWYKEKE